MNKTSVKEMKVVLHPENIKNNVIPRLQPFRDLEAISAKQEAYYGFLDMIVTFGVPIDGNFKEQLIVTETVLSMLDISADELFQFAKNNIAKNWMIKSLPCLMNEMIGVELSGSDAGKDMDLPVYVVTTNEKMYGASVILSEDIMQTVSERLQGSVLILPSSRHEVLVMKKPDKSEYQAFLEMVRTVNETAVDESDYLSDNLYIYENGQFQVITNTVE